MQLFFPSYLTRAIGFCKQEMNGLTEHFGNETYKDKFLTACKNYDCDMINDILEDVFCELLEANSMLSGLRILADKFPDLQIQTDEIYDEKDMILELVKYSDEMLRIIDKSI